MKSRIFWIEVRASGKTGFKVRLCVNKRRRIWPNRATLDLGYYPTIEAALVFAGSASKELGGLAVGLIDRDGNDMVSHLPFSEENLVREDNGV
jgi:hypothetical protein